MNLDEIRQAQQSERDKSGLQSLSDDFYQSAGQFIQDLKAQRDRAAENADDPFSSSEVQHLTDEIETATETLESIYERRTGKIVKQASFAAAGMPADTECLTTEELDLFEGLVDRLEDNRDSVLDIIQNNDANPLGDSPEEDGTSDGETPTSGDTAVDDDGMALSAAMGGESPADNDAEADAPVPPEPPEEPAPEDDDSGYDVDRLEVQITEDVGEIFGIDEREYHLQSGDVVTLPEPNAEALLERSAAKRLLQKESTDDAQPDKQNPAQPAD